MLLAYLFSQGHYKKSNKLIISELLKNNTTCFKCIDCRQFVPLYEYILSDNLMNICGAIVELHPLSTIFSSTNPIYSGLWLNPCLRVEKPLSDWVQCRLSSSTYLGKDTSLAHHLWIVWNLCFSLKAFLIYPKYLLFILHTFFVLIV